MARNQAWSRSPRDSHRARSCSRCISTAFFAENIIAQVRLFADDTAVYLTIEGANDSLILQNDLDRLSVSESQ